MGNIQKGVGVVGNPNYIGRTKYAYGKYDFAVLGGTQGAITLTGDTVPSGAIITDSVLIVDTPPTSAGSTATIAISVEGANDVQTATIVSNAVWTSATAKHGAQLTGTSTPVRTTQARSIVATVATQDLTAGVFRVVLKYIEVAA